MAERPSPRSYELGIADILRHKLSGDATIEFDVRLRGLSGALRQIDILARWERGGAAEWMVVDAKRYGRNVHIKDVEAFRGLVEDVGADVGLLIASQGFTKGARRRAAMARPVVLETVTLADLSRWIPPGTVEVQVLVDSHAVGEATDALHRAALRTECRQHLGDPSKVYIRSFRHYATRHPTGEQQTEQMEQTKAALDAAHVPYDYIGNGVTVGGGTPAHEWVELHPIRLRVLVANPAELEAQITWVAEQFGIPREMLSAVPPLRWAEASPDFDPPAALCLANRR